MGIKFSKHEPEHYILDMELEVSTIREAAGIPQGECIAFCIFVQKYLQQGASAGVLFFLS
jgi:hypothetical protein